MTRRSSRESSISVSTKPGIQYNSSLDESTAATKLEPSAASQSKVTFVDRPNPCGSLTDDLPESCFRTGLQGDSNDYE